MLCDSCAAWWDLTSSNLKKSEAKLKRKTRKQRQRPNEFGFVLRIAQTWANNGPRAKSGPPILLFWPSGTYTNLNFYRELSGRPFFPLKIMDNMAVIFKEIGLNGAKLIGIKNEVEAFYFGDHIRTCTVISKKKVFALISNQRAAPGFNSFSKSGPSCEKLAYPWYSASLALSCREDKN